MYKQSNKDTAQSNMSVLANITMGVSNMTNSTWDTMNSTDNTPSSASGATFWIEGVLTPLVSIGGLAGKTCKLQRGYIS